MDQEQFNLAHSVDDPKVLRFGRTMGIHYDIVSHPRTKTAGVIGGSTRSLSGATRAVHAVFLAYSKTMRMLGALTLTVRR